MPNLTAQECCRGLQVDAVIQFGRRPSGKDGQQAEVAPARPKQMSVIEEEKAKS